MARGEGLQAASSAGSRPPALVLVEPMGAHTWRGLADGHVPVAARWLANATSPSSGAGPEPAVSTWPMWAADPAVALLPSLDPALVPVLGLARTESAHWLLSELDDGVPVRRLLALARLTPLQAAAVLDRVHVALAALHAEGRWHGRVHAGNVHVGRSGRVRVSDWGPAMLTPGPLDGHRPADLAAAARLAGELAVAARLPQHRAGSRQAQLLEAVERRADRSHTDPDRPTALLDADDCVRATAELATVVQALRRSRRPHVPAPRQPGDSYHPGVPPPGPPPGPPPEPAQVPLVSAGPPVLRTPRRRRASPVLLAAVSVAVLGAAVAAEVALLGPDIRANWQRLTDAPADQGRDPRAVVAGPDVPVLAPAAAGPVTRVAVRPLRACQPGQVCDLRVLVQVWPDDERRLPVAWTIAVVDTCTGVRAIHPGGAARVPVGADRVDGLTHVRLPAGQSLALVAVTHQPARAASAPLLVPPRAGPC